MKNLPTSKDQDKEHGQGTVLIVEDDEYISELLLYSFQKQGFETLSAHDGLAAYNLAEREKPDVILLDLLLPKLDGREVCRLIRMHRDRQVVRVPIIMLTALTSPEDKTKGLKLGANLYIAKPYSVRDVVMAAKDLIAQRRKTN